MRTEEHNKKIGNGVRTYYMNETPEQKEKRIAKMKERKAIERRLYEKWKELNELFDLNISKE